MPSDFDDDFDDEPTGTAHTSDGEPRPNNVVGDELRSFIERYEQLEAEKKVVADNMKEVMAEAKGRGFDVKVMKKIIAQRKRSSDDVAEEEAILEIYKAALGMV